MTLGEFVQKYGWVFEDSPWVAERAWSAGPFEDVSAMHAAMVSVVASASREEQLALIRAHPDLGAKARMSSASVSEQAGAGLDQLTETEFRELHDLNGKYRERFGFPFIYAVKGSSKRDILRELRRRVSENPDVERITALEQIGRIAWFRLNS